MSNAHRWLGSVLVCLALGCGGDEGGGSSGTGGTGVAGAAGTAAGTGGTAAGTGGTTAGTTSTAPTAMDCGGVMCTVPASLGTVAPCCNPMTTTCGMMGTLSCLPVYMDPAPHMCPTETIMGMSVPGCCADGTLCGVVDLLLSGGCTSRGSVPAFIATLAPIYCADGTPAPVPDAGTPDSGM